MSAQTAEEHRAGLFDLRLIISVLFGIYGVVLTVMGLGFTTEADLAKAAGVNINLWAGLGMLVVAAVFAGWALLRPVRVPVEAADAAVSDPVTDGGQPGGKP